MRTLKIVSIILITACLAFVDLSDTAAGENSGFTKITISKDAKPNLTSVEYNDIGIMTASWYGPRFHGKLTANGEIYNQMALTAAHKSLPFGTVLKVTNIRNGKSVIVRINDRGPYIDGRDLDLSKGTAQALGMISRGVIKVTVKEVALKDTSPISTLN
ncbi:MAG: septal ring lytic transglycosylase RlpA family protein [Bacteroidetes bacterium]|nr:septal ring lytic transglycosylase RlpA family protein [Bacteroidota bacterium]